MSGCPERHSFSTDLVGRESPCALDRFHEPAHRHEDAQGRWWEGPRCESDPRHFRPWCRVHDVPAPESRCERSGARFLKRHKPGWDAYFMTIARVAAERGSCDRRRVGALMVRGNHIIATGYNGAPAGWPDCDEVGHQMVNIDGRDSCVRTIHAEENAILQCALHGVNTRGATLYTTASPCYNCAKHAVQVGVSRIVYADVYDGRQAGGLDIVAMLAGTVDMVHLPNI